MKTSKKCLICGRQFLRTSHDSYKEFAERKYCSLKCYWESLKGRKQYHCKQCGKECGYRNQFCKKCYEKFLIEHNRKILKERYKNHICCCGVNGYLMTKEKEHPYANKRGYIYKHRLIMEKHIGRYLTPIEVVHHKDGNKLNNKVNNLVLFKTTNEHTSYHGLRGDLR